MFTRVYSELYLRRLLQRKKTATMMIMIISVNSRMAATTIMMTSWSPSPLIGVSVATKHQQQLNRNSYLLTYLLTYLLVSGKKGKKVKVFPYSITSVGPRADPGVQAVSPQVTVSYPPGGRLPLLSARPAVTSPAAEHHRPLASTML